MFTSITPHTHTASPPHQDPRGSGGSIAHSPPSRTIVEHGALWAKQLMSGGWNDIRPHPTRCCERYLLGFSLHEQFRFYILSPNAETVAPVPSQEVVLSGSMLSLPPHLSVNKMLSHLPVPMAERWRWLHQRLQAEKDHRRGGLAHSIPSW